MQPDGQANCGWYFNIIPFVEAGSLYEKVLNHGGAGTTRPRAGS